MPTGSGTTGGTFEIKDTKVRLALHDLTGFDGRCDAILFTDDLLIHSPDRSRPDGFLAHPTPRHACWFHR